MKKSISKPNRVYIKGIKLNKFKAFGNETEIQFSPMVNLIFGKNSTGKSSILQALRLIRQSYSADQLTPFNLESPEKYKDNGGIDIDIQYKGIITDNKENENLFLGVKTGILSRNNLDFLDRDKEIFYEYKYNENFYSEGPQLIKDKVLLKSVSIKNKDTNLNFKIEFPNAVKFLENSDVAYNLLTDRSKYRNKKEFKKNTKKYASLYSPYYYDVKLKEIEINNLEEVYNKFKQNEEVVLNVLNKFSKSFNKSTIKNLNRRRISDIDKDLKEVKEISKIKDSKKRIEGLKKFEDNFVRYLTYTRVGFGLKEFSNKELEEVSGEIINFIKLYNKNKSFKNFKKYIYSDCEKKLGRTVYFMGKFYLNPSNEFISKYKSYSGQYRFVQEDVENSILYLYDFIVEILNFFANTNDRNYPVLEIIRSFISSTGILNRSTGRDAYGDLQLCMDKMFVIPGLRSMPKKYFAKGIQTSYVGARAENLAEHLANPGVRDDTNKWLKRLEIPYSVKVINVENHYEIIWKPKNKNINLYQNHIGLGYPLILPFIVQCLTARNNIIVVEEPEVHLHPKLQADLGELIIESSLKNDNQIILETHSEDLLLRVLKKIRQKKISPNFVSANYVLKEEDKVSEIKKIKINSQGQYFVSWKDDLFAERSAEFE